MITTYGTTDTSEGTHTDTSNTLMGAKIYATKNDLKTVSKRVGYNAFIIAEKIKGKWKSVEI
jgi:hypothetical protein